VSTHRLQSLVELGSLSPRAAAFLEASVRAGLSILVAARQEVAVPTTTATVSGSSSAAP
jgi:pilus assembly protein CpaF